MPVYRCRVIKPTESRWIEIPAASPEEAANQYWEDRDCGKGYKIPRDLPNGGKEFAHFYLIEIEGYYDLVCRNFSCGIYRKGGVKPRNPVTLEYIAKELGWTKDPQELLASGWDLEEEYK